MLMILVISFLVLDLFHQQTADHLRQLLRKWQACRPQAVRREVLPLLRHLNEDFRIIETLDVRNIRNADPDEIAAISRIWDSLIGQLCVNREIADIATSKAIHILTTGRIGPALDSNARKVLKILRVYSSEEYLSLLFAVSEDIAAFKKAPSGQNRSVMFFSSCIKFQ